MSKKVVPQLGPSKCTLCPRHLLTKNVCIEGFGPTKPKLVMIAEAPSIVEDIWCTVCQKPKAKSCEGLHRIGQPLVGPSGQLLRRAVREAGFDPETVFYTNVTRCSGGNPNTAHVRKCVGAYLLDELAALDYSECVGIVLLGETALHGFFSDGQLKLKEYRLRALDHGIPRLQDYPPVPEAVITALGGSESHDPVPIRCTYHPASALPYRNPENYVEIVGDILSLKKHRDTIKPVMRIETIEELRLSLGQPKRIAIDLEWTSSGYIRMTGLSDGEKNITVADPALLLTWLEGNDTIR